jgi:hypothetical protein
MRACVWVPLVVPPEKGLIIGLVEQHIGTFGGCLFAIFVLIT